MPNRFLAFFGFLLSAILIAVALYFQHHDGLDPCPLCIFQRVAFIAVGITFFIAFVHNPRGIGLRIYGFFAGIFGLLGAAIAARHVWLQNVPEDRVPECGPGLEFMLEAFPFKKVLETVLKGSGECAEVHWTLFGISMPGWGLIWLLILTILALVLLLRKS